ncbi:MAG: hypothetical protein ACK5L0_01635 [Candidatus Fimivivens sp.]
MKKLLQIICVSLLCTTLLAQPVFASEISDMKNTQSIYASNSEEVNQAIVEDRSNLSKTLTDLEVSIKADSIMPVYGTSLYDFAQTGALDIKPLEFESGQLYTSEVTDTKGGFAGIAMFTVDGSAPDIHMYAPITAKASSVDFKANSNRVNALLAKNNFDTNSFDAKLVFVDGLGYVYYLNNGTDEVLIAAGLKGTNGNIFTEENSGIVAIDDNLRKLANIELDAYLERLDYLASLPEGENPITGGNIPAFVVDNAAYMEKNMKPTSLVVISMTILVALISGSIFLTKRISAK